MTEKLVGGHFSATNQVSLSLQGKLTVFVINNKNLSSQEKLEFWKICTHQYDPDKFQICKAFSEEMGSDINNCDF